MAWDLNQLFSDMNSQAFNAAMNKLNEDIIETDNLIQAVTLNDVKTFSKALIGYQNLSVNFEKIDGYINLILMLDASNERAIGLNQQLRQKYSSIAILENSLVYKVTNKMLEKMEGDPLSSYVHKLLVHRNQRGTKEQEELIAQTAAFSSGAWTTLHKLNLSKINLSVKGGTSSLSQAQAKLLNPNSEVRRTGYYEEIEICKTASQISTFAINSIKAENIMTARIRGFNNVLQMCLENDGINVAFLEDTLKVARGLTPLLLSCFRHKEQKIGVDSIKWYDASFSTPDAQKDLLSIDYPAAFNIIGTACNGFSRKASEMLKRSQRNNYIDHEKRTNKRTGACCTSIYADNANYVLLTYDGKYKNLVSLAHELGHSYHHMLLNENQYLNTFSPVPINEMVAIFFELVVADELIRVQPEYKTVVDEAIINSMFSTFLDVLSRFNFEHSFFSHRLTGFVTADNICNIMRTAQTQIYGDTSDVETYNPYQWVSKPHYYYANRPYYNYPYILGRLGSYHLYYRYINEGASFVKELESLLLDSGRRTVQQTMEYLGIAGVNMWNNSLMVIDTFVRRYLNE